MENRIMLDMKNKIRVESHPVISKSEIESDIQDKCYCIKLKQTIPAEEAINYFKKFVNSHYICLTQTASVNGKPVIIELDRELGGVSVTYLQDVSYRENYFIQFSGIKTDLGINNLEINMIDLVDWSIGGRGFVNRYPELEFVKNDIKESFKDCYLIKYSSVMDSIVIKDKKSGKKAIIEFDKESREFIFENIENKKSITFTCFRGKYKIQDNNEKEYLSIGDLNNSEKMIC